MYCIALFPDENSTSVVNCDSATANPITMATFIQSLYTLLVLGNGIALFSKVAVWMRGNKPSVCTPLNFLCVAGRKFRGGTCSRHLSRAFGVVSSASDLPIWGYYPHQDKSSYLVFTFSLLLSLGWARGYRFGISSNGGIPTTKARFNIFTRVLLKYLDYYLSIIFIFKFKKTII